tara:strand:+ start:866 stop:1282 length:417 start_codon:yes stop_codon:yes gene_type:complete
MKPQSAKAKGRRLQQQVVGDLLSEFPHLSEDDIRSTSMGAGGEDILMSCAARTSIPFSFEAKNQERVNIWSSIEQARSNCPKDVNPAVVFKKNNEQPQVVIPWKVFLKLINPISSNNKNISELHDISMRIAKIANDLI